MAHPNFESMFPLSTAIGLEPVLQGTAEHTGFDEEAVHKVLGDEKFAKLAASIREDFVCAHRLYGKDHPFKGTEVHCFYASDVELFLAENGGR